MATLIKQALVPIGGRSSRLKQGGVEVPLSKPFLMVLDRPLLFWNLCALYQAGVRSLIIAGNETKQLHRAQQVLRTLPYRFDSITYFQDFGLGVHGLPYIARGLLHSEFIFECGHSISTPEHYRRLVEAKGAGSVVFSAFKSHIKNRRQPILLGKDIVRLAKDKPSEGMAIAHPIVADSVYIRSLVECNFNIVNIIEYHARRNTLKYVKSGMPPEFDVAEELLAARAIYEQYLKSTGIIGR